MTDIKIYGALTPGTTNGKLIDSQNVHDDGLNKYQNEINTEVLNRIKSLEKDINKYIHNQIEKSKIWNITHNLNSYPIVQLYDENGNQFHADIKYVDMNNLTVTSTIALSGIAVCV